MLSKNFLAAFDILWVTYNTSFEIGTEKSAETIDVLTFLKHLKSSSCLTIVVWQSMLLGLKEFTQIFFVNPEDL